MQKITADLSKLPSPFADGAPAERVETGALQINEDWPGVFIRGDNAMYYAMQLDSLLDNIDPNNKRIDPFSVSTLKGLVDTLRGCVIVHSDAKPDSLEIDDGVGC